MSTQAKCDSCGRQRTKKDRDYNPISHALNNIVGWTSSGGEEMCGPCLRTFIARLRGRAS